MQDTGSIDREGRSAGQAQGHVRVKDCTVELFSLRYLSRNQSRGMKQLHQASLALLSPLKHWSSTQVLCAPSTATDW